jgi:hypothetical protein
MAACDVSRTRAHRARRCLSWRCPRPPTAATHGTALNWAAEALKPRIPSLCNQAELSSPCSDDVLGLC